MSKRVSGLIVILVFCGHFCYTHGAHYVRLETTKGNIVLELDSAKAPKTVANFLGYVNTSFYNQTIFHRVIDSFMIQGGGLTANMTAKTTGPAIRNEAYNRLSNVRGTIAMARTSAPHTATSQFFINSVDNTRLDFKDSSSNANWGYCVFGKVIEGMVVVDSISKEDTTTIGGYHSVPVTPIIINKAVVVASGINATVATRPTPSVIFHREGACLTAVVYMAEHACFELYTLKGSTVFSYSGIKPGRNEVSINSLSAGVYVFGIKTDKKLIQIGSFLNR